MKQLPQTKGVSLPKSLPSRERGLKQHSIYFACRLVPVAPFAGAWIETNHRKVIVVQNFVAPFAGAWIETARIGWIESSGSSLPSRERGLKLIVEGHHVELPQVAPFAGAWIETLCPTEPFFCGFWSLPSRERGLKRIELPDDSCGYFVAPFAGAWIETSPVLTLVAIAWSLPSRERGLKL